MKILRVFGLALVLSFGLAACNQTEEKSETIDLSDDTEQTDSQTEVAEDDDDNSVGIDVSADEEGNVEGELEGDIKLDDSK